MFNHSANCQSMMCQFEWVARGFLPDGADAGECAIAVAATQSADHIHITNRKKAATDSTNSIKRWMATPNNSLNGNLNFFEKLD